MSRSGRQQKRQIDRGGARSVRLALAGRGSAYEKTLRRIAHGHPWVWRDSLEPFEASPGSVGTLYDQRGRFLGRGRVDDGAIGLRVFSRRECELDPGFLKDRVTRALRLRRDLGQAGSWPETDALRLIYGEGDGLPGLVVDRYGDYAVLRCDGALWTPELRGGPTHWASWLTPSLQGAGIRGLLLRSDRKGARAGAEPELIFGDAPPAEVMYREHGMKLSVDLWRGQKTGAFLDHRASRAKVRQLARGRRVLNLFSYTGGFSIAAGLGGARAVDTVDLSAPALEHAQKDWARNELPAAGQRVHAVGVEPFLDKHRGERWDLVVCDPPSFASARAHRKKALGAYRALHKAALGVVEKGGFLLAASCSSQVDREDFEGTLRAAAHGLKRELRVLARWGADADHPVPLSFPEGSYLKVLLVRVDPR